MANDREISRAEARRAVLRELDRRLRDGWSKPASDAVAPPAREQAADAPRKHIRER